MRAKSVLAHSRRSRAARGTKLRTQRALRSLSSS